MSEPTYGDGIEPWQKMMSSEPRSTGSDYSWYMDMLHDAKGDDGDE